MKDFNIKLSKINSKYDDYEFIKVISHEYQNLRDKS